MYQSYTGVLGFLILLAVIFVGFSLVFSVGGFLLGTPLGLVILGVLVLRSFLRRSQRIKAQEAYRQPTWSQEEGQEQSSGFNETFNQHNHDESSVVDRTEYASAEDVNFKEIK